MPGAKPTLFLTTRWTLVGKAVAAGETEARKALDDLFRIYWKHAARCLDRHLQRSRALGVALQPEGKTMTQVAPT
jgi:hypothetical protein